MPANLAKKTLLITGASRGIGLAIALRAARDGANVVICAKTSQPHPQLPGTVHTAAAEIEAAGGNALACVTDIRFEDQVQTAVSQAIETFGGIDIVVNNASAIQLTDTASTEMKRFDLMHGVNIRGTFLTSRLCLPYLQKSENAHILNISPPLNMEAKWFQNHVAYTMAKYGMSMCVIGMSEEFRICDIGVNALWPQTAIATSAIRNVLGGDNAIRCCRKPEIMADAAHAILIRDSRECTGNFFVDEHVLREQGTTDFGPYAIDPSAELIQDFFV